MSSESVAESADHDWPVVPSPPQTGDDEVDHATSFVEAAAAAENTLEEQLAGYEAAHRILQARLADVEG